jgi:hypothetical protein
MTLAVIAVIIVGGVWLLNLTLFILDLVRQPPIGS